MADDDALRQAVTHLEQALALLRGQNRAVCAHFVELALAELGRPRPNGHGRVAHPD